MKVREAGSRFIKVEGQGLCSQALLCSQLLSSWLHLFPLHSFVSSCNDRCVTERPRWKTSPVPPIPLHAQLTPSTFSLLPDHSASTVACISSLQAQVLKTRKFLKPQSGNSTELDSSLRRFILKTFQSALAPSPGLKDRHQPHRKKGSLALLYQPAFVPKTPRASPSLGIQPCFPGTSCLQMSFK